MYFTQNFSFGRYKGLNAKEIYQGSERIDRKLVKAYLLEKLDRIPPIGDTLNGDNRYSYFKEKYYIEIGDSLIRLSIPSIDEIDFWQNLSEDIEFAFKNTEHWIEDLDWNFNINKYNTTSYSIGKSKPIIASAAPEYIEKCIMDGENFYLAPDSLELLSQLDIYRFKGISVIHKIEDIYEYSAKIEVNKFQFSEAAIFKNLQKYNQANSL